MATIHQLNCGTTRRNVGYANGCPFDVQIIKGFFLFDSPVSFSAAQLANLQAVLQTLAFQDSKTGRCYPVANLLNPQDNSGEPVIQTFSDGSKAKVHDNPNDWTFQFTSGALSLLQALQSHNGNGSAYVIFYDKNNNFIGTNINGKFSTIPLQVFNAKTWKMNTGQATAVYQVNFVFDSLYVNQQLEYFNAGFNPATILGLQDIRMIVNGFNQATGLANISLMTEAGGQNLYGLYSADFTTSTLVATNYDTGASIPITSVTPIPGNQTFNVQLNRGSANWPSDGNVFLTTVPVSLLTAAGVPGYESEGALLDITSS